MSAALHGMQAVSRGVAAVLGALVADAASLGLHWLYEPSRLAQIAARGDIVFLDPDAAHYRDCKGYFAHGARHAGDLSGYGEYCRLMLRHLAARDGAFDCAAYQGEFLRHFGPGGPYVGYVDRPTRLTLLRLLDAGAQRGFPQPSGVDDDQLPALASLPALVAACAQRGLAREAMLAIVDDAVRVTSDNPVARDAARVAAVLLAAVLGGGTRADAVAEALGAAPVPLAADLRAALAGDALDAPSAAARFGAACHVGQGLPVMFHILSHARGYAEAIRANILAGGDSCGRSIILGAVCGAAGGVPLAWLARLAPLAECVDAAGRLFEPGAGGPTIPVASP